MQKKKGRSSENLFPSFQTTSWFSYAYTNQSEKQLAPTDTLQTTDTAFYCQRFPFIQE